MADQYADLLLRLRVPSHVDCRCDNCQAAAAIEALVADRDNLLEQLERTQWDIDALEAIKVQREEWRLRAEQAESSEKQLSVDFEKMRVKWGKIIEDLRAELNALKAMDGDGYA